MEESSTPAALLLSSTTQLGNNVSQEATSYNMFYLKIFVHQKPEGKNVTFLLGECMTGAGGEGGPRGIFLLILKHSYSITFLHLCAENKGLNQFCLLESWRFHWIFLHFHHTDDPLFGPRVESHSLL